MAKSTKYALLICSLLTGVVLITSFLGLTKNLPLLIAAGVLPAAVYELYRTEGITTKAASLIITAILILEIILIIRGTELDSIQALAGLKKSLPFLRLTMIPPAIAALFSITLFKRTYGIYTRWLAVVILAASVALIYSVNPSFVRNVKDTKVRDMIEKKLKDEVKKRY